MRRNDLISKAEVLETYAELYDIFDDNAAIREELHKVYAKINSLKELEEEQAARVMTLEEVRDNSEVVWLETKWSRAELCIVDHGESDSNWLWVSYGVDNSGNSAWKDYGKTWRCWTQRPTDEQREATQWN